jgi:site-specific DNA-methyltransferase (adenine-specific)
MMITNEDNMALMARYPGKYFDLAIVDPPYMDKWAQTFAPGAKISTTGVKRDTRGFKHWEVPNKKYFDELFRISEHQIIWGCQYYEGLIPFTGRIIWDKKNDSSTFSKAEIAACDILYGVQMFRYKWNGMLQENMKNKEIRIHPTQKPVALYKWLLSRYAKPGDKILDTHLGSGSIAIACHDLGFDLSACELDKDYFDAAMKRIRDHQARGSLFEPDEIRRPNQVELF